MVNLFCAIVGVEGSVFSVRVDESGSVDDLKKEIADDQKYDFAASKLRLFLAKKANGAWLTEKDVKKGVSDTSDLELLDVAGAPLNLVGLSEEDVRFQVTMEDVKAKTTPVHVLVVVSVGGKRHPSNGWFAESFHPLKKR
ncbi:hypothetical protein PC111_g22219, partial [Phytophthora cactorum]